MNNQPHSTPQDTQQVPGKSKEKLGDISKDNRQEIQIDYSTKDNHWVLTRHFEHNLSEIITTGNKQQITEILDYIELQSQTNQKPTSIKSAIKQLYKVFLTTFQRNSTPWVE